MTFLRLRLLLFAGMAWAVSVGAETPLVEARSVLQTWVETRQSIAKTRSDWQSDKEMLEQTIQLFERELKGVEEQMSKLGTNSTQVEKERVQAETSLAASNQSLDQAKQFATDFEGKIIKLVPQLPAPLQEILKPMLARMPTNAASTKTLTTDRIQVLVLISNELDKFNNAVTIFNEKRKNVKGEEVAVETVYIGLGAAYFVNDAGDFAGMGAPGQNGWEWSTKPELATPVREVVRIYRNEHPARFVSLPVNIK
ncbi:MAG TPA: DUF3450 family protein [Verrucomicrobiae bacterium]|nr:DUF3450 family protein [Verrucomicrobiae bacterium]